jgi:cytoskeletal protein CcmA (bactofilin family)
MATDTSLPDVRRERANGHNGHRAADEVEEISEGPAAPEQAVKPGAKPAATDPDVSVLAVGDSFSGRWTINGDGQLLGAFSGDLDCGGTLLVGRGADLTATIRAVNLTIAGSVRGNLTVLGRLTIASSGRLDGDARVGALVVEEGGVHHGATRVYPEGVPEEEPVVVAESQPEPEPEPSPVDRVKRFWGEFF